MNRDLERRVHASVDGWWDAEVRLLVAPSGRHGRRRVGRGELGLLAPTLWWATGLLRRAAPGDRSLAQQAVRGVLDRQVCRPGSPDHGAWPEDWWRTPPGRSGPDARQPDGTPRGRALVATGLALLALDHPAAFPGETGERLVAALAAASPPSGPTTDGGTRPGAAAVDVAGTSLAALTAWLDAHVGAQLDDPHRRERGTALAASLVADAQRRGAVAERTAPSRTGTTLLALSLWAERPPTPWFADAGADLRDRVWRDLLLAWHPRLRVLVPPLSHAAGLDLRAHVAAAAPWLSWLLHNTPALPPLDGGTLHQGGDLPIALVVPALAGAGDEVRALAEGLGPLPLRRGRWTDTFGNRTWTGWSGRRLVAGAERSPVDRRGDWRHVGAAFVWEGPGIGTCWLRVLADGGPVVADVALEGEQVVLRHPVVPGTRLRLLVGGTQGSEEVAADAMRLTVARRTFALRGVAALRPVAPTSSPDATWEAEVELAGDLVAVATDAD